MYGRLAGLYDNPVREALAQATASKALASGLGAPIVDLACGTGLIAVELARATGFRTIGVDRSPAMLALARARDGAESVEWIEGDITRFRFAGAGAVLCFGDVVNHLLEDVELERLFAAAAAMLAPGAPFLFDSSTRALFTSRIWNADELIETEDGRVLQSARFDATANRGAITTRVELASGEVVEEAVEERWYAEDLLADRLRAAGLEVLSSEDWSPVELALSHPEITVQKRFWRCARRP